MKNLMLLCIAITIATLAGAILHHAQTGRYQISSVSGMTGVYKIDTKSGVLSICSPVYEEGCMTLAQAHQKIVKGQENFISTARQTGNKIDRFTKDKAQDLRKIMNKLKDENGTMPAER